MDKKVFLDTLDLLVEYTTTELRRDKILLMNKMKFFQKEKEILRKDFVKAAFSYKSIVEIRNQSVDYIKEHSIPREVSFLNNETTSLLVPSKQNSIVRVKGLLEKIENVEGSNNDLGLKLKLVAREFKLLLEEIEAINNTILLINKAELVDRYLKENGVSPAALTDIQRHNLYSDYMARRDN